MAFVLSRTQCFNPGESRYEVSPISQHDQNEIRLQIYTTETNHGGGNAREVKLFGEPWIYKHSTSDTTVTEGRLSERVVQMYSISYSFNYRVCISASFIQLSFTIGD